MEKAFTRPASLIILVGMKREDLEQVVEQALAFLAQIIPGSISLYFPLLSVALTWAVKRSMAWEEEIFAWEVRPDPEWIRTKSDEFILDFFRNKPELSLYFGAEIDKRDLDALRSAFIRLYPIVGLEDPFLCALFYSEIDKGDLATLLSTFDTRVAEAKAEIKAIPERSRLLEGLRVFVEEASSLGIEAMSQKEIQKLILEVLKRGGHIDDV